MQSGMENILNSWNLQEVNPMLQAYKINDLEALEELVINSPDELAANVIPNFGLRLRLRKKMREHLDHCNNPHDESIQPACVNRHFEIPVDIPILTVASNLDCHTAFKIASDDGQVISAAVKADEPPRKKSKKSKVSNADLRVILQQHPIGKHLLPISTLNIPLDNQWQLCLSEIIALHFINQNVLLTNEDIETLSMKIIEIFPSECAETYYVVSVKKCDSKQNKSEISKGKLINKYRNIITQIRTLQKIAEVPDVEDSAINEDDNSALKSKEWLRYNREPQETVIIHWDLSYSLREEDIRVGKYRSATDIFNDWPILKEKIACDLVKTDFIKNYPISGDTLASTWDDVLQRLFKKFYHKLNDEKRVRLALLELSDEYTSAIAKRVIQLEILAAIIPPKASKRGRTSSKAKWKPTIEEAIKGIVEHVQIPGYINAVVNKKIVFMSKLKRTVQPYLIVVGANITHLEKVYVQIDNFRYEVSSFLDGLDVLFTFFITFNLAYPSESENIWYFIQWGMYNIKTKSDAQIPAVYDTINKLGRN